MGDVSFTSFKSLNQSLQVLWDKIIMRGEKTKLDLKSIKTKYGLLAITKEKWKAMSRYYFRDESEALSGETVNLTLSWWVIMSTRWIFESDMFKSSPPKECDAKHGPPHMGESRGETHFHLPNRVSFKLNYVYFNIASDDLFSGTTVWRRGQFDRAQIIS